MTAWSLSIIGTTRNLGALYESTSTFAVGHRFACATSDRARNFRRARGREQRVNVSQRRASYMTRAYDRSTHMIRQAAEPRTWRGEGFGLDGAGGIRCTVRIVQRLSRDAVPMTHSTLFRSLPTGNASNHYLCLGVEGAGRRSCAMRVPWRVWRFWTLEACRC